MRVNLIWRRTKRHKRAHPLEMVVTSLEDWTLQRFLEFHYTAQAALSFLMRENEIFGIPFNHTRSDFNLKYARHRHALASSVISLAQVRFFIWGLRCVNLLKVKEEATTHLVAIASQIAAVNRRFSWAVGGEYSLGLSLLTESFSRVNNLSYLGWH